MAIDLSNETFTNRGDVVPPSGVQEILINTGIANTLAGNDILNGDTGNNLSFPANRLSGFSNTGTLNTANGNDIITGIGNSIIYTGNSLSGVYNTGTLNTANGNDIIRGIRYQGLDNAFEEFDYDFGYGVYTAEGGTIDTGDGHDLISGISEARTGRGIQADDNSTINRVC
jgi:hypothetical protein